MYSFPSFEPVHCSMSGSNCCFLTWTRVSQEAGQVAWYSHLFKNFPVCCDPHSQRHSQWSRYFSGILLLFLWFNKMLAIWSLVPLLFINSAWTSGSSRFMYSWSLAWRVLSIILLSCEMIALVQYFEHSLALPFFGVGMKTDLFQSCGHCWVFQICWQHFNSIIFSSAGIPSFDPAQSLPGLEWCIFTSLKSPWNKGTFLKSPYPSLLSYMSHDGEMTTRESKFQGKGMSFQNSILILPILPVSYLSC